MRSRTEILRTVTRAALFFTVVALAIYCGIKLRLWWYPASEPCRFHGDINNAWDQGSAVYLNAVMMQGDGQPLRWRSFLHAYSARYEQVTSAAPDGQFDLDYPPARLFIMSLWVWHTRPQYVPFFFVAAKHAGPLLWIDTVAEGLGAILAFLVVQLVLRRAEAPARNWLALLAALLLWFDPSVFGDRVWPQWDAWVLPFYLGAAHLALHRRWLAAGACLGVGMMFKGQVLATMAVFALWPLFQLRWRGVLDVLVGVACSAMTCASPWLVRTIGGWIFAILILIALGFGVYYLPKRWRLTTAAGGVVVVLLVAGLAFGGTFAWWFVSFAYGARHWLRLIVGTPNNLPALLARFWGWRQDDVVFAAVTLRELLIGIYIVALVACAFGLARADLRNDLRVLVALATPWVLMYALMPQMHERYLYWGAALTALCAGVSLGATLLHVVLTIMSCVAMGTWLTRESQWPEMHSFLRGVYPGSAWVVLLLAAMFLYLSLAPSRERPPRRG